MSKLKALEVKNFSTPGLYGDGNGLFYEIASTGIRRWIYRYKINGKGGKYTIGRYPETTLKQARSKLVEARDLVKQGLNPSLARRQKITETADGERKKRDDKSKSFEYIALEWVDQQRGTWSTEHATAVLATLKKDVFRKIGNDSVDSISPPEILKILRAVESRGSLEIAKKVLQRINAIFRYSIQTGRATYNPAADMKGALKTKTVNHHPALFDQELAKLLKDITSNQSIHTTTKLALHFTALTACRSGEVRNAVWSEINIEDKEWHIPAERMKMKRPHIVPLSTQAIAVLNRAATLWTFEGLVFPSIRDQVKPMSDNAMSKALRDMGYRGKATPHGFRASFSSAAYEKSGFPGEVVEKCLAHEEKNKIKSAYNRAEYLEQRRQLMQWWGDQLQQLEQGLVALNPLKESKSK